MPPGRYRGGLLVSHSLEDGVTEFVASANTSLEDWAATFERALAAAGDRVLWDLSATALHRATSSELRAAALRLGSAIAAVGGAPAVRAALVCRGDADYGMARVFTATAEFESPRLQAAVFRDRTAALQWLTLPRHLSG